MSRAAIPGGMAEGVPDYLFDREQLRKGTLVELEHTSDPSMAEEIAKDHLAEQILAGEKQDYYTRLERMEKGMIPNKKWTRAYIDRLPDSAFLWVGPGGEKDDQNRTHPLTLRSLPYRDHTGQVDLAHLRNAIARLPVTRDIPERQKPRLKQRACSLLERHGGECSTTSYSHNARAPSRVSWEIARLYQGRRDPSPHELVQRYHLNLTQARLIDHSAAQYYGPGGKGEERFAVFIEQVLTDPMRGNPSGGDWVDDEWEKAYQEALTQGCSRTEAREYADQSAAELETDARIRADVLPPSYESEGMGPYRRNEYSDEDLLRDVRLEALSGRVFRLRLWDTNTVDSMHKPVLAYLLEQVEPVSEARGIFEGADFAASPMDAIDSDETLRALLGFLTLRPGDTDEEYFASYTPEQWHFVENDVESLALYSCDPTDEWEAMPFEDWN